MGVGLDDHQRHALRAIEPLGEGLQVGERQRRCLTTFGVGAGVRVRGRQQDRHQHLHPGGALPLAQLLRDDGRFLREQLLVHSFQRIGQAAEDDGQQLVEGMLETEGP